MAFPPKSAVQSVEDPESPTKDPAGGAFSEPKGPPPASPRPRAASADSSAYSSAGKAAMEAGNQGLGAEGASGPLIGVQGLSLIQRGIQMVNLAFPENPGLVAILADLTGRLQSIIPQLVSASSNQGSGMGLLAQMSQQMPQPMPMGMPPGMGGGMGAPGGMPPQGMPPGGAPPMAGPQGPPGMPPSPMVN